MKKLKIAIGYTWDSEGEIENLDYFESVEDAKSALDKLNEKFSSKEYQTQVDKELKNKENKREKYNEILRTQINKLGELKEDTFEKLSTIVE